MGGMLHYLDFHHILFSGSGGVGNGGGRTPHPDSAAPSLECVNFSSKGVEAPRNSLELDEGKATTADDPTVDDEVYDIPVAVQLVMRTKKKSAVLSVEDERRSSQAETPRTPSVIARLMGLDGLPEPSTPPQFASDNRKQHSAKEVVENPQKKEIKKSKSAAKKNSRELVDETTKESSPPPMNLRKPLGSLSCNVAPAFARERRDAILCRSLPDTPRASSARPWEVDPKRHSLQESSSSNNNNNNKAGIQHEFPYLCEAAGDYLAPPHSPSVYAAKSKKKELRKHFQDENRSPRGQHYAREIVKQVKETIISQRRAVSEEVLAKSKRTFRPMAEKRAAPDDMPPPPFPAPPPPSSVSSPAIHPQKRRDHGEAKPMAAKRESYNARFTERIKKPPPPPPLPPAGASAIAPPLCSELNVARPSRVSTTKALQLQRRDRALLLLTTPEEEKPKRECAGEPTLQQDPEYGYVKSILARSGFLESAAAASSGSRSNPHVIDPDVFRQLELVLAFDTGALRWRWNRKLLFHLVQELLGDRETWQCKATGVGGCGGERLLLRQLWGEIRRFPAANCRVLGDVDALAVSDLPPASAVRQLLRHPAVAAEADAVAAAAAAAVLDSLLEETAGSLLT
uniref:DUF3741 domain-containing protein n=1 Tax=Ananas comosus var. bracteatus TaxID=296719 RepID=A0A6V7QKC5_ANACO|nr:unnamed protein product [Ananas comosus var. bracteatus]